MSVQNSLLNQEQREDSVDREIVITHDKQISWEQKIIVWHDIHELNFQKYCEIIKQKDSKLKNWANTGN